ncbi:MAG: FG-GAP-like repeat-containing protein [Candidatus Eisenbacteria bacterium]
MVRNPGRSVFAGLQALIVSSALLAFSAVGPGASANQLFQTWIGYETGTFLNGRYPWAARSADLDGDGAEDLVIASWPLSPGFSVLFGDGTGQFGQPVRYGSPKSGLDVALMDFDEDGLLDVVLANTGQFYEGSDIALYRNLGGGVFGPPQLIPVGTCALGLAIADFDGDQHDDIAVCLYRDFGAESSVALLMGAGDGTFASPVTVPAGPAPFKVAAGDFTGDGIPDLAVANQGTHRATALPNLGDGTVGAPVALPTGFPWAGDYYPVVVLADVDLDGDLDVLHTSTGTHDATPHAGFALFRNDGAGGFAPVEFVSFGLDGTAGVVSLAVTDLNADGWPDIAATHFDNTAGGGFIVAFGDGAGGFLPGTIYPSGQLPCGVVPMQTDADGTVDLVVLANSSLEVTVHPNPGNGLFETPPIRVVQSNIYKLHMDAADLDGDDDLDIAVSFYDGFGGGNVGVLWNAGNGTFPALTLFGAPNEALAVKCRDLDGDGRKDLLWFDDWTYDAKWRRNLGGGAFSPAVFTVPLPDNCGAGDIDAVDLDNDGDLDIIATEDRSCRPQGARYLDIALNQGDGGFDPAYTVDVVELISREVTNGDFDGDGNLDLAIGNFGLYGARNKVIVLRGLGNGQFLPPVSYTVGGGPEGIIAADLTGDGILDIATNNTGADGAGQETVSVLRGRGDGTFFNATTFPGSYSPDLLSCSAIVAGDPDDDGDLDLLVSNYASNDVSFHENLGGGSFAPQIRYGVGRSPFDLLYEDFTGDGVRDLAASVYLFDFGGVAIVEGTMTPTADVSTDIGHDPFRLVVEPNPVVHGATIRVSSADLVDAMIFDAAGRRVRDLDETEPLGSETVLRWDGLDARGQRVAPGVYFVRVVTRFGEQVGKVQVIR